MAYDAFISYSHGTDRRIAESLQSALQRIAKPWYRLRALRVFRDASSLAASSDLPEALREALDQSRFLVLCASRQSAASRWVRQELDFWRMHKDPTHLLIVLTQGEIIWDPARGGFDWERTTALPPDLEGVFPQEPLWVDLREIKSSELLSLRSLAFRDKVVTLAAALHGKPKDTLDSEDVRQHRRTLRVAWSGGITLALLLALSIGAGWIAVEQRAQKALQRELATARRLTQASLSMPKEDSESQRLRALLAVEATRRFDALGERSLDADEALRSALALYPTRVRAFDLDAVLHAMAVGPEGHLVTAAGGGLKVRRWDIETGENVFSRDENLQHLGVALSNHGDFLAVIEGRDRIEVRDLRSEARIAGPLAGDMPIALSTGGRWLAVNEHDSGARVWDLGSGARIETEGQRLKLSASDVLIFSPDGRYLATTGGFPSGVWALRARDGRAYLDRRPRPNFDNPTALAFSSDGHYLVEARRADSNLHLYRFPLRSESDAVELGKELKVIAAGPDARLIAGADRPDAHQGRVQIIEPATDYRGVIDVDRPIARLALTPQEHLIVGEKYGEVSVWRLARFGLRAELPSHGQLLALHLAPNGNLVDVVLAGKARADPAGAATAQFRCSQQQRCTGLADQRLPPGIDAAAFSPDGRFAALVSGAGSSAWILETASGRLRKKLAGIHAGAIFALGLDGQYLGATDGGRVRLWDVVTGTLTLDRTVQGTPLTMALGDRGRWLLTSTRTAVRAGTRGEQLVNRYALLDLSDASSPAILLQITASGAPRLDPRGRFLGWPIGPSRTGVCELSHEGCGPWLIFSGNLGVFSDDGRFLAVHDGRGSATVWQIQQQKRITRVQYPRNTAPVALSQDARYLAVANADGSMRVLALWPSDLTQEACQIIGQAQLGPQQWERYVGYGEPRSICPQ